ncbi:MAG: haloacid dehalogenase [Chloroflexota bacterium]|nr:haloacid dehalogenase [Dehalococcoidia bacterium]MDW8047959.1 haloacid dehalogenase [Chloroflexota bacterium]
MSASRPDTSPLDEVIPRIAANFAEKHQARELALGAARAIIRASATAIRAVHRREFSTARAQLAEAHRLNAEAVAALAAHPDVYHAGFLHDAQKELAEAETVFALATGGPLPTPERMNVEFAAYLNGLGEAIGEARRMILDRLREGTEAGCEELLEAMDDIYAALSTIDVPDALTGNLRRTLDAARGILERTRGDLTMAIVQRRAAEALGARLPPPAATE